MNLRVLLSVFILILTFTINSFAQSENLRILTKIGDNAPDGTPIATLSQPSINNKSEVAFLATDRSTPRLIIARNIFGMMETEVIIDRSTPVIGLDNDAKVFRMIFPKINDNGDILFAGSVSNLPIDGGLFLYSQKQVRPVVLANSQTPIGGVFGTDLPLSSSFSINNRGDIVFLTSVVTADITPTVFLINKDKVITKVVANGDEIPNIGKIQFTQATIPSINEKGEVLFLASLEEKPLSSGIYLSSNGVIKKVVTSGDLSPQGTPFEQVSTSGRYLNSKGEVLFIGKVLGKDSLYLFSSENNKITKLISIDDPSPDGGVFRTLSLALTPSHGRLTEKSSFVFRAVTSNTIYGLFFYSSDGKVSKIVGQKDPTPLGGVFADDAAFNAAVLGSIVSDNDEVVFEGLIKGGSSSKALILWSNRVSVPKVISVMYDKKAKLLKINATNINEDTKVEINGKITTLPIKIANTTELSITGKRKQLNLNKKANSNKLVLISNNDVRSEVFTF
ncbi:MAG: hypothetical protein HY819_22230 [Acidobacteria bacterium]|nr:hypothetical protein [Acidobacteriota bacterium]